MSAKKDVVVTRQGEEVIELLVQIWIDGFMSGGATTLEAAGCPEAKASEIAGTLVEKLRSDPLAMLALEAEVTERLTGVDSGDKSFVIKGRDA